MAEERPLLALRGVSKSFGGVSAVLDITFDVRAGESVGLVGPNGAGKTTLFNCVCGQLKNDSGSIDFEGRSLRSIPTYKRARMGIGRTYQRAEVFTDMTVRDHLMVAERAQSHRGRLWRDLCNMSRPTDEECEKVDRTPSSSVSRARGDTGLCVGSRKLPPGRVGSSAGVRAKALARRRAFVGSRRTRTADLAAVLRMIQRDQGTAVLLVEHDLGIVAEVVDRAVVMDLGIKIAEGTFAEVMDNPSVRHAYLGLSV